MFGIFTLTMDLFRLGPREFYKQRITLPLIQFVDRTFDAFKTKAKTGIYTTKEMLIKGSIVAFVTTSLLWLSILMYLAFYYMYVPSIAHERPVHLRFDESKEVGVHSYLIAHVDLTQKQQLLMMGQSYKVHLNLELPESPINKRLGMFMTCADFRSNVGEVIATSCRSSMMRYRSPVIDILHTLLYSPLYLASATEEKQNLHIELFSNYEENMSPTVTDVYIEIQSRHIEVYSAKLSIIAEFTGLRYFMFNWPVLSAAIGVSSNLLFIAIVCIITWYQLLNSEEFKRYQDRKEKLTEQYKETYEQDSYSSSSIEDISVVEKYRDKSSDSDVIEDLKGHKLD